MTQGRHYIAVDIGYTGWAWVVREFDELHTPSDLVPGPPADGDKNEERRPGK